MEETTEHANDAAVSLDQFRAELDVFGGPLDLLLYLVKQEEVDIFEVPVSRITDRYLDALRTVEFFDVNTAAEFLVVAATLMEVKSRTLLPPGERDDDEQDNAPGAELVRRLLQYKEFKEAAQGLEERAGRQSLRHARPRPMVEADQGRPDDTDVLLEDLAAWDLVAAFAELMEQTRLVAAPTVFRGERPVGFYMEEVLACLEQAGGPVAFVDLLLGELSRERIVGVFLALLEMMRHRTIHVEERTAEDGRHIEISLPGAS